jgi:cytoskeletal protein RodZ
MCFYLYLLILYTVPCIILFLLCYYAITAPGRMTSLVQLQQQNTPLTKSSSRSTKSPHRHNANTNAAADNNTAAAPTAAAAQQQRRRHDSNSSVNTDTAAAVDASNEAVSDVDNATATATAATATSGNDGAVRDDARMAHLKRIAGLQGRRMMQAQKQ